MIASLLAVLLVAAQLFLGCGWIGMHIAYPAIEVRGEEVKLGEPLRIVRVEEGSPSDLAGLAAGMEILAIDEDRWDDGAFLANLVRLQTVDPGDSMTFRVRDAGGSERDAPITALVCDEAQSRERAELLASLGWMQGAVLRRSDAAGDAYLAALDVQEERAVARAMRDYEAALVAAERRMNDPEIQRRIEELMARDEDAQRRAEDQWSDQTRLQAEEMMRRAELLEYEGLRGRDDPEARLRMEAIVAEVEEVRRRAMAGDDPELAARMEYLHRRTLEAQAQATQQWNGAEAQARLDEILARTAEAQHRAMEQAHDGEFQERMELLRHQLDELRIRTEEQLNDPAVRDRIEAAMRAAEEEGADRERLLEARLFAEEAAAMAHESQRHAFDRAQEELARQMAELRAGKPDQTSMREAREEMARAMEEVRRHQDAMRDAQHLEAERVQEEVRRALEGAQRGREGRRLALYHAARAAEQMRRAGSAFRGAQFEVIGAGLSTYVGLDHGLLVSELDDDAPLAEAGVRVGDVIVSVEGRPVSEIGDLFDAVTDRMDRLQADGAERGTLQIEVYNPSGTRGVTLIVDAAAGRHRPI